MTNLEQQNEIIEYRALGYSFQMISKLTNTSKPTVIKICENASEAIKNAQQTAKAQMQERLIASVARRQTTYNVVLDKVPEELLARDLAELNTKELASMATSLERSAWIIRDKESAQPVDEFADLSNEELEAICSNTLKPFDINDPS